MKRRIPYKSLIAATLAALLVGCSTFPITMVKGRYWTSDRIDFPVRIALAYPEVDRQSGAASIEAELARLAPLLFMEYGLSLAVEGEEGEATFVAQLHSVEREYTAGWKTHRSATLDIVLKRTNQVNATGSSELMVASRASAQGDVSLASSKDLYRLLETAVRELSDGLRDAASLNVQNR